jgi:flagellar biosynthesis/type III secretory pathway protein FliH
MMIERRKMNKKTILQEKIEEFRETFLMKGSECTWESYPNPEEIEQWLSSTLSEVIKETREDTLAYKEKAVREAYQLGFREGKHEGYNEKIEAKEE